MRLAAGGGRTCASDARSPWSVGCQCTAPVDGPPEVFCFPCMNRAGWAVIEDGDAHILGQVRILRTWRSARNVGCSADCKISQSIAAPRPSIAQERAESRIDGAPGLGVLRTIASVPDAVECRRHSSTGDGETRAGLACPNLARL